jgi:uncharacterized cysteine cluster protein YcgN (CxxCxxCC family)
MPRRRDYSFPAHLGCAQKSCRLNGRAFFMSICKQCGQCCYKPEKLRNGRIRHTLQPCQFLDTYTKKCTVYKTRRFVPHCDSIYRSIQLGTLPYDCAYVAHLVGYTPSLAIWEDENRRTGKD